jgi:molecular chaperone DnaK
MTVTRTIEKVAKAAILSSFCVNLCLSCRKKISHAATPIKTTPHTYIHDPSNERNRNTTAKDKASGKANSIKITASSGLSKEEVEKMKKEAAAHEAEDKAKHEAVEAKNIAEQLIYTAEKSLKDAGDKVPADVKKSIEEKVTALKTAKDVGTPDVTAIKSATEALSNEIQKIGQYMNQNPAGAEGSAGANPGDNKGPEGGDNVKDAEFKEKQ